VYFYVNHERSFETSASLKCTLSQPRRPLGHSDPVVLYGRIIAQRIKGTPDSPKFTVIYYKLILNQKQQISFFNIFCALEYCSCGGIGRRSGASGHLQGILVFTIENGPPTPDSFIMFIIDSVLNKDPF